MPDLFEELGKLYRNINGHITSEGMRERMMNILSVWHDWGLFPTSFILGLESSLFYDVYYIQIIILFLLAKY